MLFPLVTVAPDTTGVGVASGCSVGSGASVGSPVGAGAPVGDIITAADKRNFLINKLFMGRIQQTFGKNNIMKCQEISLFTLFSIIV